MAYDDGDLDIINMALRRIGTEPTTLAAINAVPPTGKAASLATQFYDKARAIVLRAYPWRAARAMGRLLASALTNLSDYANVYRLPTDCLQPRAIRGGVAYDVGGIETVVDPGPPEVTTHCNVVFTDAEADDDGRPVITYTADVPAASLPANLRYLVALRLAMMVQKPIQAEAALVGTLAQEYAIELGTAIAADARGGSAEAADKALWTEV